MTDRWAVYILRCADGSFYTGITKDLQTRVSAHNSGRGAKYTRTRRPCVPVYWEYVQGKPAALRREAIIKKMKRVLKEKLIRQMGVQP